jgi:hypothetical protein
MALAEKAKARHDRNLGMTRPEAGSTTMEELLSTGNRNKKGSPFLLLTV